MLEIQSANLKYTDKELEEVMERLRVNQEVTRAIVELIGKQGGDLEKV
jgi:hypothetical protein